MPPALFSVAAGLACRLPRRGHATRSDDGTTPKLVVAVVRFTNMFNTVGETNIIVTSTD